VWELGGVPQRHRTDRMSLAVNNASNEKEFTRRYTGLLDYYGLEMEKIQPEEPNENGDVEQSHRRFKEAVEQTLLLRGSRDFESREAYERFLQELVAARNAGRRKRLDEELPRLRRLPERRRESYKRLSVPVNQGSLIHADQNTYSVPSRLMGETVEVRLYVEHVEVWYAQQEAERFPRLRGRKKHRINYRHIIDWLVRKPGAFENYVYREELFPTSRFRMAYDALREAQPERGHKEYLAILYLAARQSETAVDEALRTLLASDRPVTRAAVEELVRRAEEVPAVTEVTVEEVDLLDFDDLLTHKEVWDEFQGGCEGKVDGLLAGTALADVSGVF
jgi:ribosomal protein S21